LCDPSFNETTGQGKGLWFVIARYILGSIMCLKTLVIFFFCGALVSTA